jgi:hypothetical protein
MKIQFKINVGILIIHTSRCVIKIPNAGSELSKHTNVKVMYMKIQFKTGDVYENTFND